MEYSDGSETVEPGESITAGHQDLGSATYDSDGDGVADSVIVGQDEYTVVVTDHDGDGRADEVTTYDSHGNEVESQSSGGGVGDGSDDPGADSGSGTDTEPDTGTDTSASTGTDDGSDTDGSDTGSDTDGADTGTDAADGTITVVDDHGNTVEVGPATVDMDNNGTPDTAVVKGDDGSTIGYTDRDGDGAADQITRITADREVTILVSDGNGGWDVAARGHLDDNGEFVEDNSAGSSGSATAGADGGSDNFADDAPAADAAPVDISYTDANGQSYQLGAPTADFDNDGRPDTVVTTLENGTVVGYSDTDGDGLTDQVTQIDPDGTVTIGVPDGNGGWEQAATGTLGPDGEFVPSTTVTV
ncbi:DUF6802 family protein [Nakamurella lactea]|uniref:DUF6802 family protein n=1 Tax=Nakamurella lactea TaxID=459515 RepID=UPI0003F80CA7|nr:DUF6802 family protein [Nakamurella lactea]